MLLDLLFHHNRPAVFTDFPQPYGNPREASLPLQRTPVRVFVLPEKVKVLFSLPTVHGRFRCNISKSTVKVQEATVSSRAKFLVRLPAGYTKAKTGTILAAGRHDLSDEELVALFLELLA